MAATFVVHLPEALIAEVGGLKENDILRYVAKQPKRTVLVVRVLSFRDNWFVLKDNPNKNEKILEAEVEVLPERREAEATLEVEVSAADV